MSHPDRKYTRAEPQAENAFPIARPGYPVIFAMGFTTLVFAILEFTLVSLVLLAATFFVCWFFRDPDRIIPSEKGVIVSPADGRIVFTGLVHDSPFGEGEWKKVSIFMNIFNVHVNRMPCSGTITQILYHPGKFINAALDKASKENERNAVFLELKDGKRLCVVQVAGLVARRIITWVGEGDKVVKGQRYGMICFGSRLDVYMPKYSTIHVQNGDKVMAGTSILGELV